MNLLEEVAAAKELYGILLEDNEVLDPLFEVWISDISRLEKLARHKLDNLDQLPPKVQLQNLQDQMEAAVAEENYEDSAMLRDKIKALKEKELAEV